MAGAWGRLRVQGALLRQALAVPPGGRHRPTLRRRLNLYRMRWSHFRGATTVRAHPTTLVIEPTTACNLECPFCFTGAGGVGRRPSTMSLERYRRLLDELGDYLLEVRLFLWGEPLLARTLPTMIEEADRRGIATVVNTNLSLPFDTARADRLVGSGLTELTVSIDGARQDTYARYRAGGDLERVLHNCRLIAAAKRRAATPWPRFVLEFHPFPWSQDDAQPLRAMADELGMSFRIFKGQMPGGDWQPEGPWRYCVEPVPIPCPLLWTTTVVHADGGIAPCNATFYDTDDMGRLDDAHGALQVWNGERLRLARRFFHERRGTEAERAHPCYDCPQTLLYEQYRGHVAAGGRPETFRHDIGPLAVWEHFWRRRPATAARPHRV